MKLQRIVGLDSIRAICAFWVVMGHFGGPPLTEGLDESNPIARAFGGVYNNLWNGPAAVIVFFVISGFCIHYPQAISLSIRSVPAYAVRRYLRIGIPLAVAVAVSVILSVNLSIFNDSILWSLVAELVYYSIYPLLLAARRNVSTWKPLILGSFVFAFALAATNPAAGNYPSFGNALNWILGLPCWLGGCWLADRVVNSEIRPTPTRRKTWIWRASILGIATILSILRFHSPLGYPWTLNFFSIVVVFWLANEIFWFMARPPNRWLEWAGQWSYSVYLFHVLAVPIYLLFEMPNFGYFFDWFLKMFFIMATSYLFYLLIEYPGHRLARYTARAMEANRETIARRAMKRNGGGVGDGGTVCSMDRAERDKGVV